MSILVTLCILEMWWAALPPVIPSLSMMKVQSLMGQQFRVIRVLVLGLHSSEVSELVPDLTLLSDLAGLAPLALVTGVLVLLGLGLAVPVLT